MTKESDSDDGLPDKDAAKEFYAKYEPKEILGRGISSTGKHEKHVELWDKIMLLAFTY